jgi:hypothetical protein
MKTPALWATAFALVSASTALAQQPRQNESAGQAAGRVFDRAEQATSRAVNPPAQDSSFGERAGRVFDRMEDGVQGIWNRATGRERTPEPPRARVEDPTRQMGAGTLPPASDPGIDPLRRQRMDQAYRDWQSRDR